MELTQSKPLSIVILQDWTRLFAQANKENITHEIKRLEQTKWDYIKIQDQMISTVKGNIRTIRDADDAEYYEFFILEKLPLEVMEKMQILLSKLYEEKKKVSLLALLNYQKKIEDEQQYKWWKALTPEEKENRRHNVMRMNEILVNKWFMAQSDADRITKKILTNQI